MLRRQLQRSAIVHPGDKRQTGSLRTVSATKRLSNSEFRVILRIYLTVAGLVLAGGSGGVNFSSGWAAVWTAFTW